MRVLVIPAQKALKRPGIARMLRSVEARFGPGTETVFGVSQGHSVQGDAFESAATINLDEGIRSPDFQHWVIAAGVLPAVDGWGEVVIPGDAERRRGRKLYFLEPDGFIHPIEVGDDGHIAAPITSEDSPHIDRNIFVKMGVRRDRGAAYYFPYNGFYNLHPAGFGPINEFGFRVAGDLNHLAKREPRHKLVMVFGGSSAWSPCCLYSEMFSTVLEAKLNDHCAQGKIDLRFSVVNLALSGQTMLNQIISYLLFGQRLGPEVVLAHDGFNDLANGIQTDPDLLNRYDITYMSVLEQWGIAVMGAAHVKPLQPGLQNEPIRILNGPEATVRAYLARKRQFMALALQAGAQFVWGLQPCWFSKRASTTETESFEKIRQWAPCNEPLYRAMPVLYDLVRKHQNVQPEAVLVDLQLAFGQLDARQTVFVDHAHLNPDGDAVVAETYFQAFAQRVIPALVTKRQAAP